MKVACRICNKNDREKCQKANILAYLKFTCSRVKHKVKKPQEDYGTDQIRGVVGVFYQIFLWVKM
jgi:hypothetical protein